MGSEHQLCAPGPGVPAPPPWVGWNTACGPESCWKGPVRGKADHCPWPCGQELMHWALVPRKRLPAAGASFPESDDHTFVPLLICSSTHSFTPFLTRPLPAGPRVATGRGPSPTWACSHGAPSTRQRQPHPPAWTAPSLIHRIHGGGRQTGKDEGTRQRPFWGAGEESDSIYCFLISGKTLKHSVMGWQHLAAGRALDQLFSGRPGSPRTALLKATGW